MLSENDLLAALRDHWEYAGKDEDKAHEIYHPDAVLEFPQSGERFEGVASFLPWRKQYPAELQFHIRRITFRDDLVVAENLISYDGRPWMFTVNLLEFVGDKVARERIYIMDGWEAADWRSPWRAQTPADPPPPDVSEPGASAAPAREAPVSIKVVVEFQAKPGARAELKSLLADISATYGPTAPGFLGSTQFEMLDNPDGLVEIAEWDSAEAQAAAVERAAATGVYAPVIALVAAPFKATRIGQRP